MVWGLHIVVSDLFLHHRIYGYGLGCSFPPRNNTGHHDHHIFSLEVFQRGIPTQIGHFESKGGFQLTKFRSDGQPVYNHRLRQVNMIKKQPWSTSFTCWSHTVWWKTSCINIFCNMKFSISTSLGARMGWKHRQLRRRIVHISAQ